MKRRHLGWAALCLSFLLTGCELVFQAGTGLSGQAREDYLKSIKAYGEYWVKPGMSLESWRQDWVECGGMKDGGYSSDAPSGSTSTVLITGECQNFCV